jgi:hypothetical protein
MYKSRPIHAKNNDGNLAALDAYLAVEEAEERITQWKEDWLVKQINSAEQSLLHCGSVETPCGVWELKFFDDMLEEKELSGELHGEMTANSAKADVLRVGYENSYYKQMIRNELRKHYDADIAYNEYFSMMEDYRA